MQVKSRLIGRYSHGREGPLLVAIGAMHGNEPAGVMAIEEVLNRLEAEKIKNPDFDFKGSFVGIVGNVEALKLNQRFVDQDLNRSWSYESYKRIKSTPTGELNTEQRQILEIIDELRKEISISFPRQMYVMDLHTTSAHGGIFSLSTDDDISIKMALELHAPVVKGMLQGIHDSSIHFFHGQNMGIPTTAIGFECGQHESPDSVNIGVAAVINCMRTIGCVNAIDVENVHDELLINFSKQLPRINKIVGKYAIKNREDFEMLPGFKSFDKVNKGQHLAYDGGEKVLSPMDARLLMPLYQKKGNEGFFLIQEDDL